MSMSVVDMGWVVLLATVIFILGIMAAVVVTKFELKYCRQKPVLPPLDPRAERLVMGNGDSSIEVLVSLGNGGRSVGRYFHTSKTWGVYNCIGKPNVQEWWYIPKEGTGMKVEP